MRRRRFGAAPGLEGEGKGDANSTTNYSFKCATCLSLARPPSRWRPDGAAGLPPIDGGGASNKSNAEDEEPSFASFACAPRLGALPWGLARTSTRGGSANDDGICGAHIIGGWSLNSGLALAPARGSIVDTNLWLSSDSSLRQAKPKQTPGSQRQTGPTPSCTPDRVSTHPEPSPLTSKYEEPTPGGGRWPSAVYALDSTSAKSVMLECGDSLDLPGGDPYNCRIFSELARNSCFLEGDSKCTARLGCGPLRGTSTTQHNTAQHSTAQHSTIRHRKEINQRSGTNTRTFCGARGQGLPWTAPTAPLTAACHCACLAAFWSCGCAACVHGGWTSSRRSCQPPPWRPSC